MNLSSRKRGLKRGVKKRIFVFIAVSENIFPPHSSTGNACWTESFMTPFLKMKRSWCSPPITSTRSLTSSRPLQKGKKEKFGWIVGGGALWRWRMEMINERCGFWYVWKIWVIVFDEGVCVCHSSTPLCTNVIVLLADLYSTCSHRHMSQDM